MVDNQKNKGQIENLKKEIDRYLKKTSYSAYCMAGTRLKQLYALTKDINDIDKAIEVYTNAIKVEEKSEAYCNRADMYSLKGDNDSAVADFKRANEIYEPSGNYCEDLFMKNHLESISQLQGVKDTIAKLKEEGKMDPEFLKSYETLTDNVMKVANRVHALEHRDEEKTKQILEMQEQIKGLLEKEKISSGNNDELLKLRKEMDIMIKKVGEIKNDVDMIISS